MECTRCDDELIEGKNIHKNWHVPICTACREAMINHIGSFEINEKEEEIMNKRFKDTNWSEI